MALRQLEHFLIQTTDLAATRDWYVGALGMEEGPAPEFHFPVCWLYVNGTAVLHLAEGQGAVLLRSGRVGVSAPHFNACCVQVHREVG